MRAKAMEAANAIRGCQDSISTTHSAGRGAGFSDCVKWLQSLAHTGGRAPAPLSPEAGVEVSNLYEQPIEGESELLDRLSP